MSTPRRKTARQSQRSRRSFAPETRTKDPSRANAGPARQIVAAIFNTSPDVVDLLRKALEPAGIVAVSVLTHQIREGVVDVAGFLAQHDPAVVIYDIAPPYDANWHLFQYISQMDAMRNRPAVLTSTNARHVERLAGRDQRIYEVVGKPYDLGQIVRAAKEALRSRPTR